MSAAALMTEDGGTADLIAGDWARALRRATAALVAVLAVAIVLAAPAVALPRPSAALNSTDAILKWINVYRAKPEPEALPVLVRALSERQAFKDAETSGAYLGFIAGVLGANPDRAAMLVASMLPIAPADHWVLVRAIAYSGLPNWKELLATFVDRMPTRRAMIDKYLDGKLPTLDQIDYQPAKPGMLDRVKSVLKIGNDRKKAVAIAPSPELIDVFGAFISPPAPICRSPASSSFCRWPRTRTASTFSPPAAPPSSRSPATRCATCVCSASSSARSRTSPKRSSRYSTR